MGMPLQDEQLPAAATPAAQSDQPQQQKKKKQRGGRGKQQPASDANRQQPDGQAPRPRVRSSAAQRGGNQAFQMAVQAAKAAMRTGGPEGRDLRAQTAGALTKAAKGITPKAFAGNFGAGSAARFGSMPIASATGYSEMEALGSLVQAHRRMGMTPRRFWPGPHQSIMRKVNAQKTLTLPTMATNSIVTIVTPVARANLGSIVFRRDPGASVADVVDFIAPDIDVAALSHETAVHYCSTSVAVPTFVGGTVVTTASVSAECAQVCGNPTTCVPGKLAASSLEKYAQVKLLANSTVTVSSFTHGFPKHEIVRKNPFDGVNPLFNTMGNVGALTVGSTQETVPFVMEDSGQSTLCYRFTRMDGDPSTVTSKGGFVHPKNVAVTTSSVTIWDSYESQITAYAFLYGNFSFDFHIPVENSVTTTNQIMTFTLLVTYCAPGATTFAIGTYQTESFTNATVDVGVKYRRVMHLHFDSFSDNQFGAYTGFPIKRIQLSCRCETGVAYILPAGLAANETAIMKFHDVSPADKFNVIQLTNAQAGMQVIVSTEVHTEVKYNPIVKDAQYLQSDPYPGDLNDHVGHMIIAAISDGADPSMMLEGVESPTAHASGFTRALKKIGKFAWKAGKSAYKFGKAHPELVQEALRMIGFESAPAKALSVMPTLEDALGPNGFSASYWGQGGNATAVDTGFSFPVVFDDPEIEVQTVSVCAGSGSDYVMLDARFPGLVVPKSNFTIEGGSWGLAFACALMSLPKPEGMSFMNRPGLFSGEVASLLIRGNSICLDVYPVARAYEKLVGTRDLRILTSSGWFIGNRGTASPSTPPDWSQIFGAFVRVIAEAHPCDAPYPEGSYSWSIVISSLV